MGPLKQRAIALPDPVKTLILSEPDSMDSKDLISKLATWDRLLQMAQNTGQGR
jgi:hypothetical protein